MPNYSLTPTLEDFVSQKVQSGGYNNASEVVREALRLLQYRDARLSDLDAALERSLAEAENGEGQLADDVLDRLARRFGSSAKDTAR
ncbi:type II toxin-antitoxin system ParD family antitoxin [Hyphomicrobium sp.]|uniref:type II toxin-antitoxin system ParD family antitoxin n=1 Tax=Hyphomicrobium sp. TaxID=82 RepID=UPI000F94C6F4|nr:type II toxin-antitoxin system ParD family antitoxin [Hyphomicrobium sp.]RUO98575.1 MAG: type II toxin-antitoxin system ParD family antitoxin [Hyphomicrobium sp.]